MSGSPPPALPFQTRILGTPDDGDIGHDAGTPAPRDFSSLLPATFRTKSDNIRVPSADNIDFFERDLLVQRIENVKRLLWMVGRPMPPRPLHHQLMLQREIVVSEDVEHHLVWAKSKIWVKPLPLYLLDPDFWSSHILSREGIEEARRAELEACARGLLHSYCALVASPIDFKMAKDRGLLPDVVTWDGWKRFTAEVLEHHCYAVVSPRYWYGELRLSRLNKIYNVAMGSPLRGYSRVVAHVMIVDLLSDNFAVLASGLAYAAIVLTAMQVGLATNILADSEPFQQASFGFTVFSILAPLIAGVFIVFAAITMIVANIIATKKYERRRFGEIGVEPPSQSRVRRRPTQAVGDGPVLTSTANPPPAKV